MSEVDWYKGKLTRVNRKENETLEQLCRRILDKENKFKRDWHDDYRDALLDECYESYTEIKGEIYRIEKERKDECDDIFEAHKNEDGTINFEVKYYNGGCCLSEAIEIALRKLNKEGK